MTIKVIPSSIGYPHQYRIEGTAPGECFDDKYVNFSGYFGSYGPDVFAAAPELADLCEMVARLNPAAGEIGAGMLANMVEKARNILAKIECRKESK